VTAGEEEVEVEVEVGGIVDTGAVPELEGTPLGPRFEYGPQSGLGNARGQVSSWHRE
jgi:hypothetical protein